MRITFYVPPASVQSGDGKDFVLGSFQPSVADGVTLADFLDWPLADVGISGGNVWIELGGPIAACLAIHYWAPRRLSSDELAALTEYTRGQLSDGAGESGFDFNIGGQAIRVFPADDGLQVDQIDDGRLVPPASQVARAARDGDLALLASAVGTGEDIDSQLQGYTGLHLAIIYGMIDAALWLIVHGADPNAVDNNGNSPLHLCATSRSVDDISARALARSLLKHGAIKEAQTRTGQTARSLALLRKRTALAEELAS